MATEPFKGPAAPSVPASSGAIGVGRWSTLVRVEERVPAACAAFTAFLVMVAHALIETARDSLFVSHLPTSRLPLVYFILAALAILSSRGMEHTGGRVGVWRGLILTQLAAGVGTMGLVTLMPGRHNWTLYALYIWGGLASTMILIRFWLLLEDRMDASQAKRLFPVIAAGPLLGTVCGFGLASAVVRRISLNEMLLLSALIFFASAAAAWSLHYAFSAGSKAAGPAEGLTRRERYGRQRTSVRAGFGVMLHHPYVRRVTLLMLAASVATTLADYLFKTAAAQAVPRQELGTFFANTYFFFNLSSVVMLLAVPPFIRWVGVPAALTVQPLLMGFAGAVWLTNGALPAIFTLRAVDGALRWSLHKTASELLYVPMSMRLRRTVKALSDVIAHRGGQALASVVIMIALALHASHGAVGLAILAFAGLWVYAAASLRQPYLDLFRDTLRSEFAETRLEFPEFDVVSLETLVGALSSADDNEVIAAMELLDESGRARLIPALILYHPSGPVVVRALALFERSGRDDFLAIIERLFSHSDPAVRAAAVRAQATVRPTRESLEAAARSECFIISITAETLLAGHGWQTNDGSAAALTTRLTKDPSLGYWMALAAAGHPAPVLFPLLVDLASNGDERTRAEAVRAIGLAGGPHAADTLIERLRDREVREQARAALLQIGGQGFEALRRALVDESLPPDVRIQLPRTIAGFAHQPAADLLLEHLLVEGRGMIRYRILRALGRMIAANPRLRLDRGVLEKVTEYHLAQLLKLVHWRSVLDRGASEDAARATVGHHLLRELIGSKYDLAFERFFRLLGLLHRDEDVTQIYRGLVSTDPAIRSSSHELLSNMLPLRVRKEIMTLVQEASDEDRLDAGSDHYRAAELDYDELVEHLTREASPSVSYLAAFHASEIGLPESVAHMEERERELPSPFNFRLPRGAVAPLPLARTA